MNALSADGKNGEVREVPLHPNQKLPKAYVPISQADYQKMLQRLIESENKLKNTLTITESTRSLVLRPEVAICRMLHDMLSYIMLVCVLGVGLWLTVDMVPFALLVGGVFIPYGICFRCDGQNGVMLKLLFLATAVFWGGSLFLEGLPKSWWFVECAYIVLFMVLFSVCTFYAEGIFFSEDNCRACRNIQLLSSTCIVAFLIMKVSVLSIILLCVPAVVVYALFVLSDRKELWELRLYDENPVLLALCMPIGSLITYGFFYSGFRSDPMVYAIVMFFVVAVWLGWRCCLQEKFQKESETSLKSLKMILSLVFFILGLGIGSCFNAPVIGCVFGSIGLFWCETLKVISKFIKMFGQI